MEPAASMSNALNGSRILIVEDEYYLAEDLAHALKQHGAEVLGPVGTLDQARAAVRTGGFDCAILDMNLRGDMAFPIADQLQEAGIPFLIATGYNSAALPARFAGVPVVEKPSDSSKIIEVLPALLSGRGA